MEKMQGHGPVRQVDRGRTEQQKIEKQGKDRKEEYGDPPPPLLISS